MFQLQSPCSLAYTFASVRKIYIENAFSQHLASFASTKKKNVYQKSVALDLVGFCCDWMDICNTRVIYFIQHHFYVPCSNFYVFLSHIVPFGSAGSRHITYSVHRMTKYLYIRKYTDRNAATVRSLPSLFALFRFLIPLIVWNDFSECKKQNRSALAVFPTKMESISFFGTIKFTGADIRRRAAHHENSRNGLDRPPHF